MSFLDRLYAFTDTQAATDFVFKECYALVEANDYATLNEVLAQVDVERLQPIVIAALLIWTMSAEHLLPAYNRYYERANARLEATCTEEQMISMLQILLPSADPFDTIAGALDD